MICEPTIRIGLITEGKPLIERSGSLTRVRNLLIGEGFHWQQSVDVKVEGKVDILTEPQGNIFVVNEIGLENYIISVIGSEMNPDAPVEFLKAHSIISRSWALRKIIGDSGNDSDAVRQKESFISWEEADNHMGFHVCSDDHCQRYQGVSCRNPMLADIVSETRGLVLAGDDGDIADARFSKCCGGRTEIFSSCWADSDKDYLKSFSDPWCDISDMSEDDKENFLRMSLKEYDRDENYMSWKTDIDPDILERRIESLYKVSLGRIRHLHPLRRGKSDRIVRLGIEGEKVCIEVGKTLAIRRLLSENCLRSSKFYVTEINDRGGECQNPASSGRTLFHLEGSGWGHGVGLCQLGASRMAYIGKDFREILGFYYPNSKIVKLYD